MRISGLLFAAAMLVLGANIAHSAFVIDDDDGGSVDQFLMWYKRLADSKTPVVLRGICVSACTLVLTLPKSQVCVEPTASFGFHLWQMYGTPNPPFTWAGARRYYPKVVVDWLKAQPPLGMAPTYMTAEEIVGLGIFPWCSPPEVEPANNVGE